MPANNARVYFPGQPVLARRGLGEELAEEGGGSKLSERLARRQWSATWHAAEFVGFYEQDWMVLKVKYADGGSDDEVAVPKAAVTLSPAYGEPSKQEIKKWRKAHKKGVGYTPKPRPLPPRAALAAGDGDVVALRALHEQGVSLQGAEADGCTPAHFAARSGHDCCLRVLHELGAASSPVCNLYRYETGIWRYFD